MTINSRKRNHIKEGLGSRLFDLINHLGLALLGFITIGPFLYLIFGSLTDTNFYRANGPSINPINWSLDAYKILLGPSSRLYEGLRISIFVTVIGTMLSLMVSSALAYGLSRKNLPGRRFLIFFVFFTMLFGGGMVPFYLVVKGLKLTDTLWSLIFPFLVNAWYVFILMKFFESLPKDLEDVARIDGANDMQIFIKVMIPLSMPVLVTIGLFYAVGYWNEWFYATIFITKRELIPLQLVLRQILNQVAAMNSPTQTLDILKRQVSDPPPAMVMRMAAIIITIFPIAVVYPFLQKYFVKGVMVGAIKE